jgi:microcystin-dependent protein
MPQTSLLHSSIGDLKQGGQLIPTGTVLAYAGVSAPSGWLVCNGAAYSQADYADLFAALSTTYNTQLNPTTGSAWAAPTASQFRVPDLRGLFLRGAGTPSGQSAVTVGGHQSQATAKNGLSFSNVGVSVSGSTSTDGNHRHTVDLWNSGANAGHPATTALADAADDWTGYAGSHNHSVSASGTISGSTLNGALSSDSETRPMNRGVTYIIKI